MTQTKISLAGYTPEALQKLLTEQFQQPAFRAKQLFDWIQKGRNFSEMRNIPTELRQRLNETYRVSSLMPEERFEEAKSDTVKYLFRTKDDIIIECAVLSYARGDTVCVSSQAGCKRKCSFCVSGKDGLIRNLDAGEIVSQILEVAKDRTSLPSNIVFMGSGEPLDNYDEVKKAIELINHPLGMQIGIRHITLSTCGILSGIQKMLDDRLFVNLSVSMHSAIPSVRAEMMPVENTNPIRAVVNLSNLFRQESGRRITYEYSVIEGVNDSLDSAKALASLLKGSDAHVNLIDINEGSHHYRKNRAKTVERFAELLTSLHVNYTIRRKLGSSINAACGQLKAQYSKK